MRTKAVKTKKGNTVFIVEMAESDNMPDTEGACIACGEFADGVEPDARRYECECCGECKVYGIEELLVMGYVRIVADTTESGQIDGTLIICVSLFISLGLLIAGYWLDGTWASLFGF